LTTYESYLLFGMQERFIDNKTNKKKVKTQFTIDHVCTLRQKMSFC
jgi:hypothetical protein